MSWARFVGGLVKVKDKALIVYNSLPAAAKVTSMMGRAAFVADKSVAWALKIPSGLNTVAGMTLAVVLTVGVGVENIVNRGFAMYRRDKSKVNQITPVPSLNNLIENPEIEHKPTPVEIAKNATFFYPGIHTDSYVKDVAYKILQLECAIYIVNSGMGGFLSEFSLAQLIAKIPGLKFDSTCDEETRSPYAVIALVHLAAIYASRGSITSYLKSNLSRIRQYYAYFILQGHWDEITLPSYIETLIGVSINTMGIMFGNKHTWELLENSSLCHINATPIPVEIIQVQSWLACMSNFIVSAALTLPAVHNRRINKAARERAALLEQVPSFQRLNFFILGCIGITGLNEAINSVISVAKEPETINPDLDKDFSYQWWIIVIAIFCGIIALRNQLALSNEAYLQELEARAKENAEALMNVEPVQNEQSANDGTQSASIDDLPKIEDLYERDHVIDVKQDDVKFPADFFKEDEDEGLPNDFITEHTEQDDETVVVVASDVVKNDKISIAPSSALFGEKNPANPHTKQKLKKYSVANDTTIDARPLLDDDGVDAPAKQSKCVVM